MGIQTLYTAATGMSSLDTKLDVIANNLANIESTAFKSDRANFEDLFYRHYMMPGTLDSAGEYTATGVSVGLGSRVSSTQTNFLQGAFQETGKQLDLAIEGQGFFQVIDAATGETLYTRAGNFNINANGAMVMGSASTGRLLEPGVIIPSDATAITIGSDGIVMVKQPGDTAMSEVGQIQLAQFINPDGLLKLGENLYSQTDASGDVIQANPGQDGLGVVRQGMLEKSNVEPVRELIDLITTQRAFELNSQCVKTGDEILQEITNLKR